MGFAEKIIDALIGLTNRFGSKFTVALLGIGSVYFLVKSDKIEGLYALIAIAVIVVFYFIADTLKRKFEKKEVEDK